MDLLVNIDVDDMDKAIRFYTTALGVNVGRRFDAFGVELVGGSAPIYLLVQAPGTAVSEKTAQRRTYERHWTPVHLDFVVAHIEEAVERAGTAGAILEEPVSTNKWGKLARLADPFGHGICFVQFIGRGYDEIAGWHRARPVERNLN